MQSADKQKRLYAARVHAVRRALQRYGIALNVDAYDAVVAAVREGDGAFFLYSPDGQSRVYWTEVNGITTYPVVDVALGVVVTFLTQGMVRANYRNAFAKKDTSHAKHSRAGRQLRKN